MSLPVPLTLGAVNVVALVDKSGDVGLVQRSFGDVVYNGGPSSIYGTVLDVSGWQSSATVSVSYGDPTKSGGLALVATLNPQATVPPVQIAKDLTGYEDVGIRFDAAGVDGGGARFGQSLDSIAYVSNPAVTPPAFFDVRENFVFALVGNPADTTSVLQNGGRNPTFDGAGLHIVAIPYATPQ